MASDSSPLGRKRRGRPKGRAVDPQARAEIRNLLDSGKTGEGNGRDLLIEHLHRIQDRYGHLSAAHLVALAAEMGLPTTEVYEVATFYHHFDLVKDGEIPPPALTVRVCDSISCAMAGAEGLIDGLQQALGDGIRVQRVPCIGRCEQAPVAVVGQNPVGHASLDAVQRLAQTGEITAAMPNAIDYDAYQAEGGYALLRRVHAARDGGDAKTDLSAERIIDILDNAKLRGLGGAGFPAGRKWRILRDKPAPRLMAINIDEGEPGTFKDRYFLERDPHRFLEGMLIAAAVIGIDAIYIYLRDEYAGVRALMQQELDALRADPPCPLPPIHLRRGAGAYICGEESAMIESLEGKRGMPRLRPRYVANVGLFGRPTLEHNMETLY